MQTWSWVEFDLNALHKWCTNNNFTLNINKCQVMTFKKDWAVTKFDYFVNGEIIHRNKNPVKDLGILLDLKLKLDRQINNIVIRSNKMLGFIDRNCAEFTDNLALKKSVYCSLEHSVSEYGSIIWSPFQMSYNLKLEKIQQKCLRFVSYKCAIPRDPHFLYSPFLSILNLETLKRHRLWLDLY